MIHGMYVSAWGAIASELRHEVIANNLANVNTPGFRPDWAALSSYRNLDEVGGQANGPDRWVFPAVGGGAMVAETRTAHVAGPVRQTGRSTDLAIQGGEGFFAVRRGEQVRYTRAGDFRVGPGGELVTADGNWQVLGADGPLNVGDADIQVGRDGRISRVRNGVSEDLGQLQVVRFDHPERLVKAGNSQFAAPEGAGPQPVGDDLAVEQGSLEGSGTNAAEAMVRMIEANRSYEANMQLLRVHDQILGRAVSDIARLG